MIARSPFQTLETSLIDLLEPHVGDLRYKDMIQATRQAFYAITEELRDKGLTWAQVTELTGAPRTTINSIPAETRSPVAFKGRFMTELRRRTEMRMSRSEAARVYYELCDEEDELVGDAEENRRTGLDTFLKALVSMGLVVCLDDRRRSIQAVASGDSSISKSPARSVMNSIKSYAGRIVDTVIRGKSEHSARMYRTHFDILPRDLGDFLDEWQTLTVELVRRYEAKAKDAGPDAEIEPAAVVYGGATILDITQPTHGDL
jgi:hypothetical protein